MFMKNPAALELRKETYQPQPGKRICFLFLINDQHRTNKTPLHFLYLEEDPSLPPEDLVLGNPLLVIMYGLVVSMIDAV